jgi:hypothetical protein
VKLRGELRIELEFFSKKKSKGLKGTRDNKIQKKRSIINRLLQLLLQVIMENAQALLVAFCTAMIIDYLENSIIESFWMIMGIIMIALILVKGLKLKSN